MVGISGMSHKTDVEVDPASLKTHVSPQIEICALESLNDEASPGALVI